MSYASEPDNHVEDQATHDRLLEGITKKKKHPYLLFCHAHMRSASFSCWKRQVCGRQGEFLSWSLTFPLHQILGLCLSRWRSLSPPIHSTPTMTLCRLVWLSLESALWSSSHIRHGLGCDSEGTLSMASVWISESSMAAHITLWNYCFSNQATDSWVHFFLVHFAIVTIISLVVGFSISTLKNTKNMIISWM